MAMDDLDHRLSMAISPRGRIPSEDLRTLLIHRLSDTLKSVLRRSLKAGGEVSMYCEGCRHWNTVSKGVPNWVPPPEWTCERCSRIYRIEFAIYEEVNP